MNNSTNITKLTKPELHKYIKELQDSIVALSEENKKLKVQNDELTKKRDGCLEHMALDILEYFNKCNSIKKTAEEYDMTTEELIDWIPYWHGCSDGLQSARDYKEFINDDEYDFSDDSN